MSNLAIFALVILVALAIAADAQRRRRKDAEINSRWFIRHRNWEGE